MAPLTAAPALRQAPPAMVMGGGYGVRDMSYGSSDYRGRIVPLDCGPEFLPSGSLRTWEYSSPEPEQVQVVLSNEGGPIDADIELWGEPSGVPTKMRVYSDDGCFLPFSAVIETPPGSNSVNVRNIGQIRNDVAQGDFPLTAEVGSDAVDYPSPECIDSTVDLESGDVRTYRVEPEVDSVQVLLKTDGRPLNARIELIEGSNNVKQVIELYGEESSYFPFFGMLETPEFITEVRVINTDPEDLPILAALVPDYSRGYNRGFNGAGRFLGRMFGLDQGYGDSYRGRGRGLFGFGRGFGFGSNNEYEPYAYQQDRRGLGSVARSTTSAPRSGWAGGRAGRYRGPYVSDYYRGRGMGGYADELDRDAMDRDADAAVEMADVAASNVMVEEDQAQMRVDEARSEAALADEAARFGPRMGGRMYAGGRNSNNFNYNGGRFGGDYGYSMQLGSRGRRFLGGYGNFPQYEPYAYQQDRRGLGSVARQTTSAPSGLRML